MHRFDAFPFRFYSSILANSCYLRNLAFHLYDAKTHQVTKNLKNDGFQLIFDVRHMIQYNYIPFSFGKKTYGKGDKEKAVTQKTRPAPVRRLVSRVQKPEKNEDETK